MSSTRFTARRAPRGVTLIELLVASALAMFVIGGAAAVVFAASRVQRNQQLLTDAGNESRDALGTVIRSLRIAGLGGARVAMWDATNGRPVTLSPITFWNGTAPLQATTMPQTPDAVAVLLPFPDRRSALLSPLGGSTQVQITPDPRDPAVRGVTPSIVHPSEYLVFSNLRRAIAVKVDSAQVVGNVVEVTLDVDPAALQDPFQPIEPGAQVFPASLVRYRVVHFDAIPGQEEHANLVEERITPEDVVSGPPLPDDPGIDPRDPPWPTRLVAKDVEDLQIDWGVDGDDDGTSDTGFLAAAGGAGNPNLTFARVTLSARTQTALVDDQQREIGGTPSATSLFERGIDLTGTLRPPSTGHRRRVVSSVTVLVNLALARL